MFYRTNPDEIIRQLERRLSSDPAASVPLVRQWIRVGEQAPSEHILALAEFISNQFDQGLFDADAIMTMHQGINDRDELSEQASRILAQNEELREIEEDYLMRLQADPDGWAPELASMSDLARSNWRKGETVDPVPYWVWQETVLGLPSNEWGLDQGDYVVDDAPLSHIMSDYDEDPGVNLLGMLYDLAQTNEYLKIARWSKQPRGHARFITPYGIFITMSFHVAPEEKLLSYLVSEIRSVDTQVSRFMDGIPWADREGLAPSEFSQIVALYQEVGSYAELDRMIRQTKKISDDIRNNRRFIEGYGYAPETQEERQYEEHRWKEAGPTVLKLRNILFSIGYGNLVRQVWQMLDAGLSEEEIRKEMHKIFIRRD